MKNLKKWLALLLTGAMLASTLTACLKVDPDDGDEDEEEQSDKTEEKDEGLSPAEIYDKLLENEELTLVFESEADIQGQQISIGTSVKRDGDKLESTVFGDGSEFVYYVDMAQNRECYSDGYDWYWSDLPEPFEWDTFIESVFEQESLNLVALFFSDESYEKDGSRSKVKDGKLEDLLGENAEKVEAKAYMEEDEGTYIFTLEMENSEEETESSITIEIDFEDVTVTLPESGTDIGQFPGVQEPETPMTGFEVFDWMTYNYALDDVIDQNSVESNMFDFFMDSPLYNLFDEIYEYDYWNYGKMGYTGPRASFFWSMEVPVTLNSYVIYTGNDNSQYTGRNPVSWCLLASNEPPYEYSVYENNVEMMMEDGWVLLDAVYDGNMEDYDGEPYGYLIDEAAQGEYTYYCWVVLDGGDSVGLVQVNGLRLFSEFAPDSPDYPIYPDDENEWDDAWGEPVTEIPMVDDEVVEWMNTHEYLNGMIDPFSYWSNVEYFFDDGQMSNLFDEIFTSSEWAEASRDGRIYTGYGSQGKMGYSGPRGSFYWSMNEPVTLSSYVLYTANDSPSYPGRNPVGWYLLATNELEEYYVTNSVDNLLNAGWVMLDAVYDGDMYDDAFTPFGYEIDEDRQGAYQHYCWIVDYGGDWEGSVQLNGIKLFGTGPNTDNIDHSDHNNGNDDNDDNDDPAREPMTGETVEEWMDSHTMVNDLVDMNSFFNTEVGFFADGGFANLFDDVFTEAEWYQALDDGRFTPDAMGNVNVGKMGYTSEYYPAAFIWEMDEPVTLGSYVLYTANDNSTNPGRNPQAWYLLGSNDPRYPSYAYIDELLWSGWEIIDQVYYSDMDDVDFTPYGYLIEEENQAEYKYYCWYVHQSDYLVQTNGMKLFLAE